MGYHFEDEAWEDYQNAEKSNKKKSQVAERNQTEKQNCSR
jgi:hypothetical protein